ncbi:MAG: methyl-accepting chemotaxis protein [Actinomycetia bacterium]|nr:methyl-accepting chemotaxis protein [Actinomycetes bacterium]
MPLIALGFYAVGKSNDELASKAGSDLEKAAAEAGELVDRNLFERYGDVQAFAANPRAQGTYDETVEIVDFLTLTYGIYDLMMIVDLDGTVRAVNTIDGAGSPLNTSALVGTDVSGEEWFEVVTGSRLPAGGTYYTDVATQPLLDVVYPPGRLGLPYSAPIYDSNGEVAGAWHNIASFDRVVVDIMTMVEDELLRTGVGTVQLQVVRQDGIVAYGGEEAPLSLNLTSSGHEAAAASLDGSERGFTDGTDSGGIDRLYGYANADGALGFDGYSWGILASQHTSDVATAAGLRAAVFLFTVVAAAVIAGIGIHLARGISRPVQQVAEVARRVAGGDLSIDNLDMNRTDVIGELADSFDEMTDTLAIVGSQAKCIADGNLAAEVLDVHVPGEFGEALAPMIDALRSMVTQLKSSSEELAGAADGLTAVSSSMTSSAEMTSSRAASASTAGDEVSSSVALVATSIEELNATIQEVAASANEAASMAGGAVEAAQNTSVTISKLGESSQEIGDVVKVINSIAEQTNLLALNATIEAARAGEAGKGFAVVANEVKELANQTSKATGEIGQRIQAIQDDTSGAVAANERIGEFIDQISEISIAIAAAVEEQSVTTAEITTNVEEASSGTKQIAHSVAEVAEAAESTRQSTDETATSAASMSAMSTELSDLVAQYQR